LQGCGAGKHPRTPVGTTQSDSGRTGRGPRKNVRPSNPHALRSSGRAVWRYGLAGVEMHARGHSRALTTDGWFKMMP